MKFNLCARLVPGLIILLAATGFAKDEALKKEIEAYLNSTVEHHNIVGLAAAVTVGDEILYMGAFGTTKLEGGQPMKPENLFHFASVSKPFVATAIMQLVEKGKMDLNERVVHYLPYFKLDDARYKDITILQMLNHTSGMTDVEDYEWDKPQTDEGAAERFVRSLTDQKMIFNPGEKMKYSNMAFDVVGDVIARVSGMSFEDYVERNILDPLGMKEGTFLYPKTNQALRTAGHTWLGVNMPTPHYPYNRRHAPSSTLNSNVLEMTYWMRANLNHGIWKGQRFLSEENHKKLWTPTFQVRENRKVGLSWFLSTYNGMTAISHGGSDEGVVSNLTMIPEKKWGVVIASNYDNAPVGHIARGIFSILMGNQPEPVKLDVLQPVAATFLSEGFEAAKAKYQDLAAHHQADYNFDAGQLNTVGYHLMTNGQPEAGQAFFKFNAELYPQDPNCWDSLAESYLKMGDKETAIKYYRKALELNPQFENSLKMLKKLESEK